MAGFDEDFPGTSEAPELLTGARESAPNVIADKPGQQIAPTTLGGGGMSGLQSLANLAASFIGGGISRQAPQASANIAQTVSRNLEEARQKRAGDQLNAASTLLGQAYESGDHKVIAAAHKSLGDMLKGAEPEVQKHFGDMAIKAGQQLGQQAKTQSFMDNLPDEVKNNPQMMTALKAYQQGVDPRVVDQIMRTQQVQAVHFANLPEQAKEGVLRSGVNPTALLQAYNRGDPQAVEMMGKAMTATKQDQISGSVRDKFVEYGIPLEGITNYSDLEKSGKGQLLRQAIVQEKYKTAADLEKIRQGDRKEMKDYVAAMSPPPK